MWPNLSRYIRMGPMTHNLGRVTRVEMRKWAILLVTHQRYQDRGEWDTKNYLTLKSISPPRMKHVRHFFLRFSVKPSAMQVRMQEGRYRYVGGSVTRKKLPNVYKSCLKMISQEKRQILTPFQNLPTNVGDLGNLVFAKGFQKLPKVQ